MNIEKIEKTSELAIAVKYMAVDFSKMADMMGQGYQKLWDYVLECGKQVAGAPYCKYTNGSDDFMVFDIELGWPLSEPLPEQGDFFMTKTDEGKAIAAIHKGAYKDVEGTYIAMMKYLAENNLESTGVYYDYYLNDPSCTPEDELLTKVIFPIK
ncbi:MAG: GyrI-like domain-containing protein [Proteobacteria bacterium]|nr:GyrI-like domain-containing protein [Pseudomonadota bacterium]MCL2326076.1 GyrI-like domain-containing protein [Pseudomonadota bacterium]